MINAGSRWFQSIKAAVLPSKKQSWMSEMKFIVAQNVQNNKQMDLPSPPAPTPRLLGFFLSLP